MTDFLEELNWRGQIQDHTPGLAQLLKKEQVTAYLGADPTGPSLHIGHLASISMLRHFQKAGHKPIMLVGGATGMVGDPSGKSKERNLLTLEQIRANANALSKQLELFLDMGDRENHAEVVNNYDWFKEIGMMDFLRDVGKHFTINNMLSKESVSGRMESGISFTEFSYQLLQAYDFLALYRSHGCKLQLGGADQWGNMTSGIDLIRRIEGTEAQALTFPLVTRPDGSKFGKTAEGNNIYLDPTLTSPYAFYQFWINLQDEQVPKMLKIFSFKDRAEIEQLISDSHAKPGARIGQRALAEELTARIHGQETLDSIEQANRILFGKATKPEELEELAAEQIQNLAADIPQAIFPKSKTEDELDITELFMATGFAKSKTDVRRLLKGGGLRINKHQFKEETLSTHDIKLIHGRYLLLQIGKKHYALADFSAD